MSSVTIRTFCFLRAGSSAYADVVERERDRVPPGALDVAQRRAQLVVVARRAASRRSGGCAGRARARSSCVSTGVVAVVERELALRRLGAEVLDLDEDLVRRLVRDVAAHVERDDADVVAALADRQVADVDADEVDRGEVLVGAAPRRPRRCVAVPADEAELLPRGTRRRRSRTISGFLRSRSASAAAPSARVRSAGVSLAVMPSTIACRSIAARRCREPRHRRGLAVDLHDHRDVAAAHRVDQARRPSPSRRRCGVCVPASSPSIVFIDAEASTRITTLRALRSTAPSVGSSAANSTRPRISSISSSEMQPLELLPQRVRVLLLEDALPQLRERHLEAAPPHLDDVRADRERSRADGDVRPRSPNGIGPRKLTAGSLPSGRSCSTSSSNGIDVCVRKNGIAYFVQYASSSLQYFSCSRSYASSSDLRDRDLARVAGLAVDEREVAVQVRRRPRAGRRPGARTARTCCSGAC